MLKKQWNFTGLSIIFLLLSACGSQIYHYVKRGDTLYSVSFQYGQDYHDVAYWNGIRPPYNIYPNQKLRVYNLPPGVSPPSLAPIASLSKEADSPVVSKPAQDKQQSVPHKNIPAPVVPRSTISPAVSQLAGPLTWVWPAEGKLLQTFSEKDNGRKGIDISNSQGTIVKAAASGSVVYSGDGLVRYGNLIIIKHNENYLSAYAHNNRLLVKEGQAVQAGQGIAEMGNTGTEQVMLHFEIRYNGTPVDPLHYLPKRS